MTGSAEFREETVELATGRVHLLRAGAGDPLVVLHHSTGNFGWVPFYGELGAHFDVIVPDLPGYGGSERPTWAREPRDLAILVGRVLERLDLHDVALVGLGFGGFVAAELATANASRLSSLVLIGAAGLKPEEGEILDQMMVGHRDYVKAGFRDEATYAEIVGEPEPELRRLWDASREMTARVTWKPYMFSRRLAAMLPDVQVPSLVLCGERDAVVPPICAEQYARLLPNATLERVADAGHLVELEQPIETAQRIAAHAAKALRRPS